MFWESGTGNVPHFRAVSWLVAVTPSSPSGRCKSRQVIPLCLIHSQDAICSHSWGLSQVAKHSTHALPPERNAELYSVYLSPVKEHFKPSNIRQPMILIIDALIVILVCTVRSRFIFICGYVLSGQKLRS